MDDIFQDSKLCLLIEQTSFRPVKKQHQPMLFSPLCFNELDSIPNLYQSEIMTYFYKLTYYFFKYTFLFRKC